MIYENAEKFYKLYAKSKTIGDCDKATDTLSISEMINLRDALRITKAYTQLSGKDNFLLVSLEVEIEIRLNATPKAKGVE